MTGDEINFDPADLDELYKISKRPMWTSPLPAAPAAATREAFGDLCARLELFDDAGLEITIRRYDRAPIAYLGGKVPDWVEQLAPPVPSTPQQRALPRPATTPPMWAIDHRRKGRAGRHGL